LTRRTCQNFPAMNDKLVQFEEMVNKALNECSGELEVVELIGVLQMKIHCLCSRLQKLGKTEDENGPENTIGKVRGESDPADYWKDGK
jgi:hypothetical protein